MHLFPGFSNEWDPAANFKANHIHAIYWYFMSCTNPLYQCDGNTGEWSDFEAPGATMGSDDLKYFYAISYYFEQTQGLGTMNVADDCLAPYER